MAELSSNWKILQARLKAGAKAEASTKTDSASKPSLKRKSEHPSPQLPKKTKTFQSSKPAVLKPATNPSKKPMGGVLSTQEHDPKHGVSPSLALWGADNDISAETLAEAYHLGEKSSSMVLASETDKVNRGLSEGIEIGKYIAIDCEMVGVGPGGHESSLARVSIVDFHGKQIYDSYVAQKEKVTNWRTHVSGISQKSMRFARPFEEVQSQIASLMSDRILVGHDLKHDLDCLKLSHPARDVRDTAKYGSFKKYGNGRKPSLRNLAQEILGVTIQSGAHSSVEDARVTMLLFRKHKSGFDVDHANRYTPQVSGGGPGKGKKKKKGKK